MTSLNPTDSSKAIAASIAVAVVGYDAVMTMCARAAICTSIIYAYVYADLKRKAPTLADAR